jgi:PAS domain S-box-containing protein
MAQEITAFDTLFGQSPQAAWLLASALGPVISCNRAAQDLRQLLAGAQIDVEHAIINQHPILNFQQEFHALNGEGAAIVWLKSQVAQGPNPEAPPQDLYAAEVMLNSLTEGVVVIDTKGVILLVNQAIVHLFGYQKSELYGQNVSLLMTPRDQERHDGYLARYVYGVDETRILGVEREVRGRTKDGAIIQLALHVSEILDRNGQRRFCGTLRDLSQQKALSEQLHQARKMEAVGQLTGGIAHDFNNLLTVIIGHLDLLQQELPATSEYLELVEPAFHAAQRGADLTGRLLAFARRQMLYPRRVDLNASIKQMLPLLTRTIGEHISIYPLMPNTIWPTFVDPAQLENVLLNLFINARDAMPNGGAILLQIDNYLLLREETENLPEAEAGDYIQILVTDTGTGMPEEVSARAFEPFFTTKGQGRGTGLGLSMAYGFVRQSKGHISLHSELGLGTTIRILLPRDDNEQVEEISIEEEQHDLPLSLKILVVEDSVEIRQLAVRILKDAGHKVWMARDAYEAMQILRCTPEIAIMFTDLLLPGRMNGLELASTVRQERPELKILFTTGRGEEVEDSWALGSNGPLLRKPYRRQALMRALHSLVLEETTPTYPTPIFD